MPEINVPSFPIITTPWFHLTNSVIATLLISFFLILFSLYFRKKLSLKPGRLQVVLELLVDFFLTLMTSAWGSEKRARKFIPLIFTIFLFLLIANQFSNIPLVSSIMKDGIQVLRTPSSDLTLTVTLAIVMVMGSHAVALVRFPIRHLKNFFKFHLLFTIRKLKDIPHVFLEIVLGLLDIISEIARVLSMSFRLFGNVFAGEVMIGVMTGLVTYVIPMPFMFLSAFSGIVQAFVFSILSLNFMAMITRSSEPS